MSCCDRSYGNRKVQKLATEFSEIVKEKAKEIDGIEVEEVELGIEYKEKSTFKRKTRVTDNQ